MGAANTNGMDTAEKVEHVFTRKVPTKVQADRIDALSTMSKELAHEIARLCPPSADRTVAIRHVRDALMNAVASIVHDGISP